MAIKLSLHQLKAIDKMHNGCILNGGVGTGKSRTALAYFFKMQGGYIDENSYKPADDLKIKDLYIITTAKKRDDKDWESEMIPFLLGDKDMYKHKVVVDSWNNIKKYIDVQNAFFIFDEQRVVGTGVWVKSFLKITKSNQWILLSATPGDTWSDYIPVFIANGFYKNKTQFNREHIIFKPFTNYPIIDRYIDTGRLMRLRRLILVDMDIDRHTEPHIIDMETSYDRLKYRKILKDRWNPYKNEPIENASELCQCLRRVCNEDPSKQIKILEIFEDKPKLIVFYNYDYELEILKNLGWGNDVEIAEWNGHKHQPIPESSKWVYLVQYNAGAEGWNCIRTDTIVFYSQNYSFKIMEQARGRINRMNTPYIDLYYYNLKSKSSIDLSIDKALRNKKKFNEGRFANYGL